MRRKQEVKGQGRNGLEEEEMRKRRKRSKSKYVSLVNYTHTMN